MDQRTSLPCRHRRHDTCEHATCSCLCHVLAPAMVNRQGTRADDSNVTVAA